MKRVVPSSAARDEHHAQPRSQPASVVRPVSSTYHKAIGAGLSSTVRRW